MTALLTTPADIPVLGPVQSRVAMAAMTRNFAPAHLANPAIAAYYGRRAKAGVGLILTEGVIVDPSGDGYKDVPHIATQAQAESWRPVIAAVHSGGGRIFCQLWHCGRISHADFTGGVPPVSSTARPAEGTNRQNNLPFGTPRPLTAAEMPAITRMFALAARRALAVGFDGVQVHMGHGYLVDQFLDARVNDRGDAYGGSVANRCRFAIELMEEVMKEAPPGRVMVRLSPSREMNGPYDWPDMDAMLAYLIPAFAALGLGMLDISCAAADYFKTAAPVIDTIRRHWKGAIIGGASLAADRAEAEIASGRLDMVTWGRALIANPDLVGRIRDGRPFEPFDRAMLATLA